MNSAIERRLLAIESALPKNQTIQRSPEETARQQRMGITGDMRLPANIAAIGACLDGNYPSTMTPDDIEWFEQSLAKFEESL